jgi:hypothetical protein
LGEFRTISTAGGGLACTTTAKFLQVINGANWLALTARNFSTAVVVKFALNPYLTIIKTSDDLATVANLDDYSENAQDGSTATSVTLSSLPAGDFLYVGAHVPFRGVDVDVDATNSTPSTVLTVKYWDGSAWSDISVTDGTSSSVSLDQDGQVTWTVPSDWVKNDLVAIGDVTIAAGSEPASLKRDLFWTRWEWDQALDSTVTLDHMLAMNRNTAQYGELIENQSFETAIHRGPGGIAVVEALTDAGTANLIANVGTRGSGGGFA